MTLPALPPADSTNWYAHYWALDAAVRAGSVGYPVQRAGGGEWYMPTGSYRDIGTYVPADGELHATPFYVGQAVTVNALGTNFNPGGSTGSVIRQGIYRAGTDGMPATLVVDAGTADGTNIGNKVLSFTATPLPAGLYWLVVVAQGGATTKPTLRTIGGINMGINLLGNNGSDPNAPDALGFSVTGYPGALPTTFSMTGFTRRSNPLVSYVRVV